MPRYFLKIAYDGTNYHGWQVQPNAHTVQAEVDNALSMALSWKGDTSVGCGRTDSGVHAQKFYLHFNLDAEIEDTQKKLFKLNSILPKDIVAHQIILLEDNAHARFDAVERSYQYFIRPNKNPFKHRFSSKYKYPMDINKLNEISHPLIGRQDFASFCKAGSDQQTTICDVRKAEWTFENGEWVFTITADRFLRNMVRAIVGSVLDISRGKIKITMEELIQSRNRDIAGVSAKAHGLHLTDVKYPYLQDEKSVI